MSLSASRQRPFVILGNPESNRVSLFQQALVRCGQRPATVVSWLDFITVREHLARHITAGCVFRIESPGRNFDVERLMLQRGAKIEIPCGNAIPGKYLAWMSEDDCRNLVEDRGRIVLPGQWFQGFVRVLWDVSRELTECPEHTCMSPPENIALMSNKIGCSQFLDPDDVPRMLGPVDSYEGLVKRMRECGIRRVFIKLANGSSGSGVVAYQTNGRQHKAVTTVEVVRRDEEIVLYNSRRLRTYTDELTIRDLVDSLCSHRVHAEQWIPKAGMDGSIFDLRIVTVAQEPTHIVPRLSRGPITNLHLLNRRGDPDAVRRVVGEKTWSDMLELCRRTAGRFASSLYTGIDVAITSDLHRCYVLEVNAFGDLLPGWLVNGKDTYETEIEALVKAHD